MTASRIIDKVGIALLQAADLIERHGWWGGRSEPLRGDRLCAVMAIYTVDLQSNDGNAAQWRLKCHVGCVDLAKWNDASDAVTVVQAMRAAAVVK